MTAVIQYILYLVILVALAVPLGAYIKKVMNGRENIPVQGAHPLRKPGLQGDAGEQG